MVLVVVVVVVRQIVTRGAAQHNPWAARSRDDDHRLTVRILSVSVGRWWWSPDQSRRPTPFSSTIQVDLHCCNLLSVMPGSQAGCLIVAPIKPIPSSQSTTLIAGCNRLVLVLI
uniref:Putative secreted protein n=1 Tax=Anopheles darlingi TaxID=43151 RepID=A0A2M4DJA6_ANODA